LSFLLASGLSRASDAVTISRREFLRELNEVLPEALDEMTKGSGDDRSPVAPVDLSQAIIGPGVQRQLRHSDARITLGIYGHVIGDEQRCAVQNRSARLVN
jgi:hypothetical protein